jgi:hypothetical protein
MRSPERVSPFRSGSWDGGLDQFEREIEMTMAGRGLKPALSGEPGSIDDDAEHEPTDLVVLLNRAAAL